ncbi:TraB/GumN family protein [Sulfurimonas sp.]|uniref:TraB/GumN family protein n=1 Tax=Sulfurimonas sp. TaxID=2022749 RepID=UPI003D1237D3
MRIIFFLFIFTYSIFAHSFVWKVQKGDSTLYLGGTIHLLRPADFPLPKEFEQAYKKSDILTFETEMGKLNNLEFQQQMMGKMLYTDSSTLQQHLSAKTYKALSEYFQKNNINIQMMQQMRASMVAMTIEQIELMKLGISQDGVDSYFYKQALSDQKQTDYFETLEEQLSIILDIGKEDEDAFVRYTLESMKDINEMFIKTIKFWKNGEEQKLSDFLILELKRESPQLYNNLIVKRNKAWLPKIQHYLQTQQTEFVLVGAGHLIGPDGLLEALKQKGYSVTKL